MPLLRRAGAGRASSGAATTARSGPGPSSPTPTPPAAPAPQVDPLLGDPDAHHFRAELARGRWQELHTFLETMADCEDRQSFILRLAHVEGRPAWLDEWVAARPGSALPLLFRGTHGIAWAWQARGSGRASTVAADAWQEFYSRLVSADRDLARAAALDPADPNPHARSIWSAIGLALGASEIRRRFDEVALRHPLHYDAHHSMLQALAAKWYGSTAQMMEFARSAAAQAPEGHSLHALIAEAHIERWLDLPRESADGGVRQDAYFADSMVQAEIRGAAARSIGSPHYVPGRRTPGDQNMFAMCLWMMKDHRAQLALMDQIGPRITAAPWQYLGEPGKAYQQARDEARQRATGPGAAGGGA